MAPTLERSKASLVEDGCVVDSGFSLEIELWANRDEICHF
ncbi:unnamed protein product [Acidithrix sp. C25]|nr:unnamed protein product [Acidithrix sp. C25]